MDGSAGYFTRLISDMQFRFDDFILDDECRELRLEGQEVEVQPLVFDLLCYLIRHRDRVVPKQELLDALWDDAIVVDGALQRVVSLARTALRKGKAEKTIRTYARRGYRFSAEIVADGSPPSAASSEFERVRAAFERNDWDAVIDELSAADARKEVDGPDLERWARALQCTGRISEAVVPLERAVATYALAGDWRGYARAALSMAYVFIEQREVAVAQGWHTRAGRHLEGLDLCDEHAMFSWLASRLALYQGDNEGALSHGEKAIARARRIENSDIEAIGLVYSGHAMMALGDIDGGMARHDEAAAAVLAGEVQPWHVGTVYCGIIWACRNLGDWKRAAQWTEQFTRWCRSRPGSRFPTTCQLHRAEVLTVRGDLDGAESEVTAALDLLSTNAPWAEGEAHRIRGDLFLMRGDLDGAGREFALAIEQGWDPQPGYAILQAARSENAQAIRSLERSVADASWCNRERLPDLLAHLVMIAARSGDVTRARSAMAELDDMADGLTMPAQRAALERARAELAASEGRMPEALASLRRARHLWEEVGAAVKATVLRMRVAELLLEDGDPTAARAEISAAARSAHAIGLDPLIDGCTALAARVQSDLGGDR